MAELRHLHLGAPKPPGRGVLERLAEAYAAALSSG